MVQVAQAQVAQCQRFMCQRLMCQRLKCQRRQRRKCQHRLRPVEAARLPQVLLRAQQRQPPARSSKSGCPGTWRNGFVCWRPVLML